MNTQNTTFPVETTDGYSFSNALAQAHRVETRKYANGNTTARVVLRSGDVVKVRKLSDEELAKKVGAAIHELKLKTDPGFESIVTQLQISLLNISAAAGIDGKELSIADIFERPLVDWLSLHYAVFVLNS